MDRAGEGCCGDAEPLAAETLETELLNRVGVDADVWLACQAFLVGPGIRFSAWYLLRETVGGCSFGRGALYHLLRNRIYRGEVVHRGTAYPGEQKTIVDDGT
jgi:site-specific DNA recombinase